MKKELKMGIRKLAAAPGYEEMDGNNIPHQSLNGNGSAPNSISGSVSSGHPSLPSSEFELASVSVVPDGEKRFSLKFKHFDV